MANARALAHELAAAYATKTLVPPPSTRDGGLDLATAYAVEHELMHLRQAEGHRTAGVKVGFANKAMWRALKLDTLVWAHVYDDTVKYAGTDEASLSIVRMVQPKIEPEIVFRLRRAVPPGADAAATLDATEWIALGFEIIDSVYPAWTFTPIDFVASYGLHAGLVVGSPLEVTSADIPALVDQLAAFTVTLEKNGAVVAKGSGKNSLKNPALCIAELSSAMAKAGTALSAGEVISSGTLTEAQLISPGETYTAVVEGLAVGPLTLRIDS
jgi:2-oxo-3-hexenedioate decarboxylase